MNRDGPNYKDPQTKAGFTGFSDQKKANVFGILNAIIENSINAVALFDAAQRLIYVNESFLKMWGYETAEEIIGKNIREFWQFPEEAAAVSENALLTGGWGGELTARKKDGSLFCAQISASIGRDEAGEITYLMGIFLDITAQKLAQETLRKNEERFRVAQELSLDAFTILTAIRDDSGSIVDFLWDYANPKAAEILKHEPSELIGKRLLDLLPGNKTECDLFDRYVRVVETGEPHDYELKYESEGIHGWFRNMAVKLGDGIAIHFADITDRKHAEEKLHESKIRLIEAQRLAQVGDWIRDFVKDQVFWSRGMYEIFGRDPELPAPSYPELARYYTKESWRRLESAAKRTLETGEPYELELETVHNDGTHHWHVAKGEAILDSSGHTLKLRGTAQDITARKRMEKELCESEFRYHTLFDSIDEGFCIIEVIFDENSKPIDYRFLDTNPAFDKHTGLVNAKGKRMRELVPMHEEHWFEIYGKIALTGQSVRFQNCAEKLQRWYDVYAFRFGQPEDRQVAVLFYDISDRVRSEKSMRQLSQFPEEDPNPVLRVSADGNLLYANAPAKAWLADLGWKDGEPIPAPVRLLVDRFTTENRLYEVEEEVENSTGKTFLISAVRPRDEDYVNFYCRDITERKQAEAELRAKETELRLISDSTPVILTRISRDLRFIYVNQTFSEVFGRKREEIIGKPIAEIMGEKGVETIRPYFERVLQGQRVEYDTEIVYKGIGPRYMNVVYTPERNEHGEVVGWFASIQDVTERKRAEEALRHLNENLEQQVAERTELAETRAKQLARLTSELTLTEERERRRLADILHEHLQQLLVGIKLNLDALSDYVADERKPTLDTARKLLTDSIQTSRSITAELSPPILYQNGLIAGLEWLARWKAEKYGFRVDLQVEPEFVQLPEDIIAVLFRSVRELLLNAMKHSGAGSAKIILSKEGPDRLRIVVSDSGKGFDPDRIWKREQESGFGLFAIRERMELMGGSLEIESSPGNGASLSLLAPLELRSRDDDEKKIRKIIAKVHKAKRSGDKIQVLIVDDHTVVRQGLSTMLNLHADVEVIGEAADGEEAIKKARKLQPDVILMDISMPNLDGIDATKIIHAEFPHTRIIGLSMHVKQDQAARMLEAGATAYCTKDGSTDVLLSAIRGEQVHEK